MTSLPTQRGDFARQTSGDDEVSIGPGTVLPDLPAPSAAGRVVLALFEGPSSEIEILVGPSRRLH